MSDLTNFAEELVIGFLKTSEGQTAAKKCIVKVIESAIESATGYNSDFRKQVDAAMVKALQLTGDIEIESYNDAILKVMAAQLQHATADTIERQVAERMKRLLEPAPTEIKLSELIEKYREYLKNKIDGGCVCHGEGVMTFLHDQSDSGFDHYSLDEDSGKSSYKCDIRFGIYKSTMYHLAFQSGDVEKQLFVGPLYDFQRLLFQMKAAQTKVVIDCTPDDVELAYANYD